MGCLIPNVLIKKYHNSLRLVFKNNRKSLLNLKIENTCSKQGQTFNFKLNRNFLSTFLIIKMSYSVVKRLNCNNSFNYFI